MMSWCCGHQEVRDLLKAFQEEVPSTGAVVRAVGCVGSPKEWHPADLFFLGGKFNKNQDILEKNAQTFKHFLMDFLNP